MGHPKKHLSHGKSHQQKPTEQAKTIVFALPASLEIRKCKEMSGSYARRRRESELIRRKKMRDRMIAQSNERLVIMQYALTTSHEMAKQATTITRATKKHFATLDWNVFYQRNRTHIRRVLRMTKRSFDRLTDKLTPYLRKKGHHQRISPKLRLYVYLRWLAGVPYTAICDLTGISSGTCYRLIDQVCADIISCKAPEVDNIHFPQTIEQVKKAAAEFQSISHKGVLPNVVSAIDGYLVRINAPPKKIVKNSRSYFSGHYQCMGVNVQAACDAFCRFQFIGVAGPGSMPNSQAVEESLPPDN